MDWRLIIIVFVTIFLAELGDKTQLATLLYASKTQSGLSVFIGASLALIFTSFLGAFLGEWISKYIPQNWINIIAGIVFIIIGIFILIRR
ncbi:MAG: TMEM165/GDT1 family protein [Candidatus Desulfofervidus auxilii]|nr:TMEM165/GDT1 family protein [Candidatus Desulfofervidus auxilii]